MRVLLGKEVGLFLGKLSSNEIKDLYGFWLEYRGASGGIEERTKRDILLSSIKV